MPGDIIEDPTQPWSPTNPFGTVAGESPPARPPRPAASPAPQTAPGSPPRTTTAPTVRVDQDGATTAYTGGQNGLQEHHDAIADHDPSGLDDPDIADSLHQHTRKTKDRFADASSDLADGKAAASALGDADRRGTDAVTRASDSGALGALRSALAQPTGAANPFAPLSAMPQMPQMPMPQMPMPQLPTPQIGAGSPVLPPGMVNVPSEELARLISTANVAPPPGADPSIDPRVKPAAGGQVPLAREDVAMRPTGLGSLTESQLRSVIDKSLDNNDVTKDPRVRKMWHEILQQQFTTDSPAVTDAVNHDSAHAQGAPLPGDNAPAAAGRGLGQLTPDAFAEHHVGGTSNNIYDPEANVSAAVNDLMQRAHIAPDGAGLDQLYQQRMGHSAGSAPPVTAQHTA